MVGQSKHGIWSLVKYRQDLRGTERDLNMEDSEKREDMTTVPQIFKRNKQACPISPQKVQVRVMNLAQPTAGL